MVDGELDSMAEYNESNIRGEIDVQIQAKKGIRLGDDKLNKNEKELYESILAEKGSILTHTDEALSKDFHGLLEDVADISEIHQLYLREIAKILDIPLKTKGNALQMNYPLFQKILQFQAKHNMALTGIIDKTLYEKILAESSKTQTTDQPATKPASVSEPKPAPERQKEDPNSITTISTLPSGLQIARGPRNSLHPLISENKMTDMVIAYEGPGGERRPDTGNTFDLGGGINNRGPELERKYAFGDNYALWTDGFIPKDKVPNAIERTLEARIARTYESCKKRGVDFDSLPLFAQKVLVDLHYNMTSIQTGFPKFWQAIKSNQWREAGKQLMDSGTGSPNTYLNEVYTRAYANAMMLANEDPDDYEKYIKEASGILNGTQNAYLLYNAYFGKTGKYGTRVNVFEKIHIAKETKDPLVLIDTVLSDDVLRADKKSTNTIQSLISKHLQENPGNRDLLIDELKKRFGGLTVFLDSGEKVASYQIYISMTEPERFKKDIVYIDGEYGPKTQKAFFHDAFAQGDWKEKIEGTSGILQKSPEEIKIYTQTLGVFEKTILKDHYDSDLGVSKNSPLTDIKKVQFGLLLSGKDIPVDGKWTKALEELLGYSERAKKLAGFVRENYGKYNSGKNSCGESVGKMLTAFGIRGLPSSDRNGENWNEILDALVPSQFIKVKIDHPGQARPGGTVCYEDGGIGGAATTWGHVETKGSDGAYYHYLRSERWGGSRGESVANSHFTGYVYYPRNIG